MKDFQLTNEADFLLCSLYNGYLQKRKDGVFREKAVEFGSAEEIQNDYAPSWPTDDIEDAVRELDTAEMVSCFWADNTFLTCVLTASGITYMENRFGRNVEKIVQRITAIKSLLWM